MPKELSHFHIARLALAATVPGPLRRAAQRCPAAYLLGAVVPDAPLYGCRLWPGRRAWFAALDRRFHHQEPGPGLRWEAVGRGETALALAMGVASHLVADGVFHPLVWYLGGREMEHHFAIETGIDLLLARSLRRRCTVAALWRAMSGEERRVFLAALARLLDAAPAEIPALARMVALHGRAQGWFEDPFLHRLIHLLVRLRLPGMATYHALFYPLHPGPPVPGPGVITYRQPVTGEFRADSVSGLAAAAADRLARLFSAGSDPATLAASLRRLRINPTTGVAGRGGRDLRFFAPAPGERR